MPRHRGKQPGDPTDQRGFARTVWTEDAQALAAGEFEAFDGYDRPAAVTEDGLVYFDE
jgi:hypothetical protein